MTNMLDRHFPIVKRVLFTTLCFLLGQPVAFSHVISQSFDNTPYIYYYSFESSAFIIERADGTEKRVLADYQLPANHTLILGDGWSPSGKWFAWTSESPFGTTEPNMNVHIVSRDGSERTSLLDRYGTRSLVKKMHWSPSQDLLLFSFTYVADSGDSASEKIVVYDPLVKRIIFEFENPHKGAWFLRINWAPDGKSIGAFDRIIYVLPLDNQKVNNFVQIASQSDGAETCSDFGSLPHWINEKTVAYVHPIDADLVINNLVLQQSLTIDLPDGVIEHVDWSQDGKYALVYLQTFPNSFNPQLWLISIEGDKQLLADTVRFSNNCNIPFDESAWNKNNQAFFITSKGQLYLASANQGSISKISIPKVGEVPYFSPIRWVQDRLLFIWTGTEYDSKIYSYSPEADVASVLIPETVNSFFNLQSSNVLFYNESGLGWIVSLTTGDQIKIKFLANTKYGTIGVYRNFWHPRANWLFLASTNIETEHLINIVQSDGTNQRQLSLCRLDSKTCFGWLPLLSN